MSGGSSGDQPVPGKEDTKQKSNTSSKATTAATTTPTLPDWLSQMLQGQAGGYADTTGQFGQAVQDWQAAGFTPDQLQGFEMQRQAALGPQQSSIDELLATTRGDYLYGGPGFNAAVDAAYRAGVPQTLSQFGGAGRDENFLGKASLNQIYSDAFARQYGTERGYQQQAAQALPALSLLPGQTYQNIGALQQQLEQYGLNYPLETLYPQLAQLYQGSTGFASPFQGQASTGNTTGSSSTKGLTTGTSTPSYFPGNQTAGLLGGIATGAGTGGMIGGPWGALIGAGVGGGLTAFG